MWNWLEKFTERSHRMEGDHRNYSCRRKKMWSTHSCLVQGDQPRTEGKYSTRTRAVMRKWNERTNPACGDYSRKYSEIVARHKETPWKSETDRVGRHSKDARSSKGNAYSHKRMSSLPSLMARAASSPILCS